jgi:VRR-NUC domain
MKVSPELEQKILDLAGVKHEPEKFVDEKAFMAAVVALAKRNGHKVYHTRDSRKSEAGFPDLVFVREAVITAELKVDGGKLTAAQASWVDAFNATCVPCWVWFPKDWERIEAILK